MKGGISGDPKKMMKDNAKNMVASKGGELMGSIGVPGAGDMMK